MAEDRFQKALEEISNRFAMEIVTLIRTTTVEELVSLARPEKGVATQPEAPLPEEPEVPARRRGRPPKAKTEALPVEAPDKPVKRRGRPPKKAAVTEQAEVKASEATEKPETKPKQKRAWPKCSIEGCGKGFYAPSGEKRLCYRHHIAGGGAPSPLVLAAAKKKVKAEAPKTPKAGEPRTIRRKKADTPKK